MDKLWVKTIVSTLALAIAAPVYAAFYFFMRLLWDRPVESDAPISYTLTVVIVLILVFANYVIIGAIFKGSPQRRKVLISIAILPAALYLAWFWLSKPGQSSYRSCDLYTEEMNGGVKTFQGQSYNIVLCGINGGIDPDNWHYDEIRLQVFSMGGELLAERAFDFDWELRRLKYGDNHLIYADGGGKDFQTKMPMPPTRWDWLRARLPRLWP